MEKKDNTLWIVLGVAAAILVLGSLGWGGMMGTGWTWAGWWFLMPLMMLVPLGLLALLVYLVVRAATPQAGPVSPGREDPRTILDRRFAEGQISREEHAEALRHLDEARRP